MLHESSHLLLRCECKMNMDECGFCSLDKSRPVGLFAVLVEMPKMLGYIYSCNSPLSVFFFPGDHFLAADHTIHPGQCYSNKQLPRLFSCDGLLNGLPWFAQSNNALILFSPSQREHAFAEQQWCRVHCRPSERGRGSCEQRQRFHTFPPEVSGTRHAQHDCRL